MTQIAIVLNGTSSSGKTSIAKAIQCISKTPMLHASLDTFTDMFHWPAITDQETKRECHRLGVDNFHAVLPILVSSRFPIIVDSVFEQHEWYEACHNALKGRRTFYIGVHCPIFVLEEREKMRGDRRVGLSRWQFDRVHQGKIYSFEVDTSKQSVDQCAAAIMEFVANENEK